MDLLPCEDGTQGCQQRAVSCLVASPAECISINPQPLIERRIQEIPLTDLRGGQPMPNGSPTMSNREIGRRLLNVREAARYRGLEVDTVYKKARLREVPSVKVGRALRFDVKALERFIEQHAVEPIAERRTVQVSIKGRQDALRPDAARTRRRATEVPDRVW